MDFRKISHGATSNFDLLKDLWISFEVFVWILCGLRILTAVDNLLKKIAILKQGMTIWSCNNEKMTLDSSLKVKFYKSFRDVVGGFKIGANLEVWEGTSADFSQ